MRADLGRVFDNPVGLGDLAQRIAAMAFLAPAPLARARAQALQDPRLLLQPVARGRLGTVGAVQARRRRSSAFSASSASIRRISEATRSSPSGATVIPPLSQNPRSCRPKSQRRNRSAPGVTFRTHPAWQLRNFWTRLGDFCLINNTSLMLSTATWGDSKTSSTLGQGHGQPRGAGGDRARCFHLTPRCSNTRG